MLPLSTGLKSPSSHSASSSSLWTMIARGAGLETGGSSEETADDNLEAGDIEVSRMLLATDMQPKQWDAGAKALRQIAPVMSNLPPACCAAPQLVCCPQAHRNHQGGRKNSLLLQRPAPGAGCSGEAADHRVQECIHWVAELGQQGCTRRLHADRLARRRLAGWAPGHAKNNRDLLLPGTGTCKIAVP